ncbi:MAG: ATP-grasp domain-containing protein [Patescibacteria group bacterium]
MQKQKNRAASTNPSNQDNLKGKTLLVVNSGYRRKEFILKRIQELGCSIVLLNKEENWAQKYIDVLILADTYNHAESLEAVKKYAELHPIDGVVTFWEDDVLLTAKIVDMLGLPGIPYRVARVTRNKYLFREFCKKAGVPAPQHRMILTQADVDFVVENFTFPIIAKPVYGSSSALVVKVEKKQDLSKIVHYITENISEKMESALSSGTQIFAEEYLDGQEVDIDMLIQNGKVKFYSISDNEPTDEPFFIELGDSIPSSLLEESQEKLVEMAAETLEKLGIQQGCIHFEAKWTKKGPFPIEVNIRMGGDYIHSFVKGCWDVDLVEYAAKIALGVYIKPEKPEQPLQYLKGHIFMSDYSGVLVEIDVDEELTQKPYLDQFVFLKEVGDPVLVPPEGYEYLGWVCVKGESPVVAENNLEEAIEYVHYTVAKYHPTSSVGKTIRKTPLSLASFAREQIKATASLERVRTLKKEGLRVGVLCNIYTKETSQNPEEKEAEEDTTTSALQIKAALEKKGHEVELFDMNQIIPTINRLARSDVDIIFNACERINHSSLFKPHSSAILDILNIPYTGSNPFARANSMDKIISKKILKYHGIPTPEFDYMFSVEDKINPELEYPLIVKPANTDDSIGITQKSVVTNERQLLAQAREIITVYKRPVLVEEYIVGSELDIGVIGNRGNIRVLPIERTLFDKVPKDKWGIYSYEDKWGKEDIHKYFTIESPARIPKKQMQLASEIAIDVFNALGCHDYARVEMRMDKDNNLYVIELNAHPTLEEDSYFGRVGKKLGLSFGDMLQEIIEAAAERYTNKPPFYHLQGSIEVPADLTPPAK